MRDNIPSPPDLAAWNVEVYPASGTPATANRVGEIYHKGLTAANGSATVWQSVITRRDTGSPTSLVICGIPRPA